MSMRRIVVESDDSELFDILSMWLGDAGYETVTDGEGELRIIDTETRGEGSGIKDALYLVYAEGGHYRELRRPFTRTELVAALRRISGVGIGEIVCDPVGRRITYRGDHVDLTGKEYEVMRLLYERGEAGASREEIAAIARRDGGRETNAGDVYVHHLRRKLEELTGETGESLIRTVRGVGYVFAGK